MPISSNHRTCGIACDPDEKTVPAIIDLVGNDRFFWNSDYPHAEAKLVLRPNASELCEDETIRAYMRRVKLDVLTAAITQYPSRTAAAERLGLTKEALKRQLRYLRNATARSANTMTNDREES